jgi:aminocarboxymuconate-semialdehyde decarboxylase
LHRAIFHLSQSRDRGYRAQPRRAKLASSGREAKLRKIDVFTHIWPQPYFDRLQKVIGPMSNMAKRVAAIPMIADMDRRFEVMDTFGEDYCQILSLASPAFEEHATPEQAAELSKIGSDAMAEICQKYPDRFPGFLATPPMSNTDKMIDEARRAVEELGTRGFQVYSNIGGKPLDLPEFEPFWNYAAEADVPVFLHPYRTADFPDYKTEDKSQYEIWWTFGWPYETSVAMARLVFSKTFDRLPNLKVLVHHAGAMVPFFEGRVGPGWSQIGKRTSHADYTTLLSELKRPHLDYFKGFYTDTASFGSRRAIEHAIDFFGLDHVLFASDSPFDPEGGPMYIRETIKILDGPHFTDAQRHAIYEDNPRRLLKLPA